MACEQKVFASLCVHMAYCTLGAVVMFLLCRFGHSPLSLLALLEELCHCPAALRPVRGRNKAGLEEELTALSSFGNLWVANKATSLDELLHLPLSSTDSVLQVPSEALCEFFFFFHLALSLWSLCDLQWFSRHQLHQWKVEGTELLIFKTAQVQWYKAVEYACTSAEDIFMENQNCRYEDIFPSGQFAGWHNFTKALLGALSVLVNGETAPAVLASLIHNVRCTFTSVRIECAQKLRTRIFHPIKFWTTNDLPPPKTSGV